tara:strand:+ start:847 stop:1347 length:501 start_codon:yes stop_codon:yes gene_type:complete
MTIVKLEPWEWVHALSVGARRHEANWNSKDAAHYDRRGMEDDRTSQARACVCELAVAKKTNRYWSGSVWYSGHNQNKKKHADVGRKFEVKHVRTKNFTRVDKHMTGKGMYLFVAKTLDEELKTVEILGWIEYDAAWELGTESQYKGNCRDIHIKHLKSLDDFEIRA